VDGSGRATANPGAAARRWRVSRTARRYGDNRGNPVVDFRNPDRRAAGMVLGQTAIAVVFGNFRRRCGDQLGRGDLRFDRLATGGAAGESVAGVLSHANQPAGSNVAVGGAIVG